MKRCTKCKATKSLSSFSKDCKKKDGLDSWCKLCNHDYHIANKEVAHLRYLKNKIKILAQKKESNLRVKKEVFERYGNKCLCCGETNIQFLTIDYINGKGCQHRKEIGVSAGKNFYHWLKRNNYPNGFQVLCFNCNCGRQVNGGVCPHKEK